jgi:hypothetical protein
MQCDVFCEDLSNNLQSVGIKANEICRIINNTFGKHVLQNMVHHFVVIPLHFVYPSDHYYTLSNTGCCLFNCV